MSGIDEFWIMTIRAAPEEWVRSRLHTGLSAAAAMREAVTPARQTLGAALRAVEIDVRLFADELARRGLKRD